MRSRRGILRSAGLSLFASRSFVVAAANAAQGSSVQTSSATRFGLNVHLNRFEDAAAFLQLAAAKATGIKSIRGLALDLAQLQPQSGRWNFSKSDRDLELIDAFGFEAIGLLGYGVAWASVEDPNHNLSPAASSKFPPSDPNVWKEYAQLVIERYSKKIRVWAPWNEPDSFHYFMPSHSGDVANPTWLVRRREKFLEIQQLTYALTKRIDPDAVVLSGGFAMGGSYDKEFLPWLVEHGLLDHCDALDLHSYWAIKFLESTVAAARILMDKAGKRKPIWLTEFGAALRKERSWIGMYELDQIASLAVKAVTTSAALGIERLFWYQGFTESPAPTKIDDPGSFSLSVTDGPTPAYWSFSAAAQLLSDARYKGPLRITGAPARGYQFSIGQREVIILWAVSPDGLDNRSLTANCQFNWQGRKFPIALSERPTILMTG
jgi:hypothetical protein